MHYRRRGTRPIYHYDPETTRSPKPILLGLVIGTVAGFGGQLGAPKFGFSHDLFLPQRQVDLHCMDMPRFLKRAVPPPAAGQQVAVVLTTGQAAPEGLALAFQNLETGEVVYQQPENGTWDDAGWLGPIARDEAGNLYVAPVPRDATAERAAPTTIWRVNGNDGVMTPFATLEPREGAATRNPFGIVGMSYDCRSASLYVSSVAGSGPNAERGQIVQVRVADGEQQVVLNDVDAIGLAVTETEEGASLIFGSARNGQIFALALNAQGGAVGQPRPIATLADGGVAPSLRARRIDRNPDGSLIIIAVPFAFTLETRGERIEERLILRPSAVGGWVISAE